MYEIWKKDGTVLHRELAFEYSLPILSIVVGRFEVDSDEQDELLQQLSIMLYEMIDTKYFTMRRPGAYFRFIRRVFWQRATRILYEFRRTQSWDFFWARVPPPTATRGDPQDTLYEIYQKELEELIPSRVRDRVPLDDRERAICFVIAKLLLKERPITERFLSLRGVKCLKRQKYLVDLVRVYSRLALYEEGIDDFIVGVLMKLSVSS